MTIELKNISKVIGGIEPVSAGEVVIDGQDVSSLRGKVRTYFYRLTGFFAGVPRAERRERARKLAEDLGIRDALALSWKNIIQHEGRSAIIVLTISVLFGVLIGVNFVLRGLEVSALNASVMKTGGVAYTSSYHRNVNTGKRTGDKGIIQKQLKDNHGVVVGFLRNYSFQEPLSLVSFNSIQVVDYSAVEAFVTTGLTQVPEGKVPVLAPEGGFQIDGEGSWYDWLRSEIAERYYIVGYLPTGGRADDNKLSHEYGIGEGNGYTPTVPGFNLLNLVLGNISGGVIDDQPLLVDDGSGVVARYLDEKVAIWREAQQEQLEEWQRRDEPQVVELVIARFNNPLDVVGYTAIEVESEVVIGGFVTDSSGIAQAFHMSWMILIILEIIVLVVAVVIATFTFAHLVDQDANTIALYRSMGATANNVYLIYFLYLLELCLMAIVASLILGVIISGVMAWMNIGALAEKWQSFWALSELPKVSLFGIDWHFWMVVIAMLLIAPVALIFAQGRFSSKHVAKQLKEE